MAMGKAKTTGELRHRVGIQTVTEPTDAIGQPIQDTWTTTATVWGHYEPTSGQEIELGGQVRSTVTGLVTIRRRDGITAKQRLMVNGWGVENLILNILAVTPPNAMGMQVIYTTEAPSETVS